MKTKLNLWPATLYLKIIVGWLLFYLICFLLSGCATAPTNSTPESRKEFRQSLRDLSRTVRYSAGLEK